jgi:hypothetical protein
MLDIIVFIVVGILMTLYILWIARGYDKLLNETLESKQGIKECTLMQRIYQDRIDNLKTHVDFKMDNIDRKIEEIFIWVKSQK